MDFRLAPAFQTSRSRRRWLQGTGAWAAVTALQTLGTQVHAQTARNARPQRRMPVIFIGHGSPMNAISDSAFMRRLARLGAGAASPQRHSEHFGPLADARQHGHRRADAA